MAKTLTDILTGGSFLLIAGFAGLKAYDYHLEYERVNKKLNQIVVGSTDYNFLAHEKFVNDWSAAGSLVLASLAASSGIYFASRKKEE
ncbi:MAG TPA: hypothetical protein VJB94_01280 [Candidatus Nanoarchaeia archaeon]|nr:hypothetical protein [Candidatus Nanoarchaeia archaeon]